MSTGQIHDLGYKRYVGLRRSVGTRWTVIMRHQIATGWKTWWRFKVWLVAAVLATGIPAALLYVFSGSVLRMFTGIGGQQNQFVDVILPLSLMWYCKIGFLVSLFVGVPAVAGDIQSGAFTFYFARSLRPRDYVIGKLVGLGVLVSLIMLVGPVLLAGARLGLSDNLDQLITLLPVLPKALAIGALGTLIYAAVPLGFSAIIANRGYAMALWAAYYVVISNMALLIGAATNTPISALDLPTALEAVSLHLFDLQRRGMRGLGIPLSVAVISILGHAAIAIALVFWRVRSAQRSGVGGSS
jgi:ABC-type transport system involved in multi-copper enzyme maturation permease subunit